MTGTPGNPKRRSDAGRTLSIRLPEELLARLDQEASTRLVSRSFLAERLIIEGLDDLIPVADVRLTRRPERPS